jgi:hypothetical protein
MAVGGARTPGSGKRPSVMTAARLQARNSRRGDAALLQYD